MPFENWEEDHKLPKHWIIIIALIGIIAITGTAIAIYKITSPPSDPVTVATPATLSQPTVNATSAITGDILQLTTSLSDNAEGLQVFFFNNASVSALGSAYTDSTGTAIFNTPLNTVGVFTYTAECLHP